MNQLQALEEEDEPAGTSKGNQLEHLSGPSMMMSLVTTSCSADEERSAAVGSDSTSRRKQQLIQSRASMNQLLLCIQSQDVVPVASKLQRYESSRKHFTTNDWTTSCKPFNAINVQDGRING
ncbi:F-box/LRR-repeat protein-like [Dorcoceras hygrometricum]|uniref:F-box/LRR-repeat protein-like n=1 Tax=Dorcoceras hygrometricum TaxID=472368 RepID=A0A2Z7CPC8_9LAMI|nr:F-box/LRR-repeat protein-like [Dorcoceras hygrometricum]